MTDTRASMHESNEAEAREQLWSRVEKIKFCMFTTIERDGSLRSRPLTTQDIDEDGAVWFFVAKTGEVATVIAENTQVNLAYADTDDNIYVSVCGTASLSDDREKIEALWTPMAAAWFPGGVDDPNLALLRVQVSEAEYWKPEGTKIGQFVSIARAAITRTPPRASEHAEVRF